MHLESNFGDMWGTEGERTEAFKNAWGAKAAEAELPIKKSSRPVVFCEVMHVVVSLRGDLLGDL